MTRQFRISLAPSGNLTLHLPQRSGIARQVEIPSTMHGLSLLQSTLQEASCVPESTVGTKGSPTQWNIDQLVKNFTPKKEAKPKPDPSEIELDFSSLDLSNLTF